MAVWKDGRPTEPLGATAVRMRSRRHQKYWAAFLIAALLAGGFGAYRYIKATPPTPREIVAAIEKQVGPSDAPPGSTVGILPYQLPVPTSVKPVRVGVYDVYPFPDTQHAIVVRPMAHNVRQTFMYLYGDKAPARFDFKFTLLPKTRLEKDRAGAVSVCDTTNKKRVSMIKAPWALSVKTQKTPVTDMVIQHDVVTQVINLKGAKFPVLADPEFIDPLTQIMDGRLRELMKDGPSHDLYGYGRWYMGPNGLEIRFNNRGSLLGAKDFVSFLQVVGGFGPALRAAMNNSSNRVIAAAAALGASGALIAEIGKNHLEDLLENEAFKNFCIGITVPKGYVLDHFMRLMFGLLAPAPTEIKLWGEKCDPSKQVFALSSAVVKPTPAPAKAEAAKPVNPKPTQEQAKSKPAPEPEHTTVKPAEPTRAPPPERPKFST